MVEQLATNNLPKDGFGNHGGVHNGGLKNEDFFAPTMARRRKVQHSNV